MEEHLDGPSADEASPVVRVEVDVTVVPGYRGAAGSAAARRPA
jgi:hypothetical protein